MVCDHFLGPNNLYHMAAKAEFRLTNSTYHGEKNTCNFECYVTVLKEQHQILYNFEEYGYKGIDDDSKVYHLNDSIKNSIMDTFRTTILAYTEYLANFGACVTLYKYFLMHCDNKPELKISDADTRVMAGAYNSGGTTSGGKYQGGAG